MLKTLLVTRPEEISAYKEILILCRKMEQLNSYLTKEGWAKDWDQTKRDFRALTPAKELTDKLTGQSGSGPIEVVLAIAAMPVCAYLGSYVGEGFGYVWGNVVDFVPYVRDVAPWLAERTGLIKEGMDMSNLNENLYQTSGAVSGFWAGLGLPWRIMAGLNKE